MTVQIQQSLLAARRTTCRYQYKLETPNDVAPAKHIWSGANRTRTSIPNSNSLPSEIWCGHVLTLLSLNDLCKLDSAMTDTSLRPGLLNSFIDLELEAETIVSPDMIDWFISKGIKPLRVKLVEDITFNDILRIVRYCPQLASINTWDFQADAQSVLKKSRRCDDHDARYERRSLDEILVFYLLQQCNHLKSISLCEMEPCEWWPTFECLLTGHHGCKLHEVSYHQTNNSAQHNTICHLTRTHYKLETPEAVPIWMFASLGKRFSSITSVSLHVTSRRGADEGVMELAKCCPALTKAILHLNISNHTLIEFCRLQPNLIELQLEQTIHSAYDIEGIRQALQLLPGLQVYSCYLSDHGQGIASASSMTLDCWDYVLGKCTKLHTIRSEAGQGTGNLRSLARQHGVRIEQADRATFDMVV